MMEITIFRAIILGAVQGLTELLPISSSAHLFIIPWICGWGEIGDFDVALHFGTLLAIGIFFFKDWLKLIKGGYDQAVKKKKTFEGKMFWYIVIATIPGGIIGYLLDHYCSDILTRPEIIGCALIFMGIVLYIIDRKAKSKVKYEEMNFKQTFLIGLSQALAFIPGVSRSGVTMTTARAMGIERESAAKYSFMLSAPIVLAATIFKLKDFIFSVPFFVGILVSFLVGIVVIKFLLKYLQKGDFKIFAIYRIVIGIVVLLIFINRV